MADDDGSDIWEVWARGGGQDPKVALGEIVIDFYGHLLAADCIGHGLHAFNDCLAQLSAATVPSR